MSPMSPTMRYQQALADGNYQPDDVQKLAVERLDKIYQNLVNAPSIVPSEKPSGLKQRFSRLLGKAPTTSIVPVQGLYMWGGVGRGKTWLMDMFYESLPGTRKLRLHFHRFMKKVQEDLMALQGQENPLDIIADEFKKHTDVLCFDEFFVSDITDAMILGTLLEGLFARGITLVATSNIIPDDLYRNGLQRARFLPAIEQIKKYCDVMNVDAGIDYRLRTLTQAHLFLSPINSENRQHLDDIFVKLAGKQGEQSPVLEVNHRKMQAIRTAEGVLAIEFKVLCEEPRSQNDYIYLSNCYHTILLYNVPAMGTNDENSARRFLALIDEFYERKVKLIINAAVPMESLYQGQLLAFEYQRCLSRLQEMQSEEYLKIPHLA
ncbi:cell division protein ZapE [Providencia rettgeri]|uniref:Cell division protein ZapE n=1 Tax=Providencia rettgeri TaxID=587 RepID=A0AAP2NVF6_PRORE|nr:MULTISPECIES: cell division protein ZapE [Providencia]MBC8652593.1 cell division protein ZapE [Providencia vermicola]ELR5277703.1 AFG1 family ATPase [Providencia rettgeri]MBN6349920.1 AFG1 family ATPase [Providencia rettgeri]MBX6949290.1 cell division protein ZapE [Providencia rettgeri]MBX6956664.1 cell division protein ZapE [Providencia rettgeri]